MSNQNAIYQQVILDHNRKPKNFGKLNDHTHEIEGLNPLCGDHLWVYMKVGEDEKIVEISFNGTGCAISKASASMMTSALKGKTVKEAHKIFEEFNIMLKKGDMPKEGKLGSLKVFSSLWQYPSRVKCAALAWHAMANALTEGEGEDQKKVSTE